MSVIVLGGGVSGLSAAFFCAQRGLSVTLVEQSNSLGGWFSSRRTASGVLIEEGPHSFRPVGNSGLSAVKLIEELGLLDEALGTSNEAKKRFVWTRGKMHELPSSIVGLFMSPLTRTVPWLAVRNLLMKRGVSDKDESVYDFISQRFSPYVAETLLDSMISGIYAGDIRRLSVNACFPILRDMENEHGSVVRGLLSGMFKPTSKTVLEDARANALLLSTGISFKNGLQQLTSSLEQQTFSKPNTKVYRSNGVAAILENGQVRLVDGELLKADTVISTVPIPSLARAIPDQSALIQLNNQTSFASVGVVNVAYNSMEHLPLRGFGHLVPSRDMDGILGVIYDSEVFPGQQPHGVSCVTVMMGGMQLPHNGRLPQDQMKQLALQKLHEHLGITDIPLVISARNHHDAIPQFALNHKSLVAEIRADLKSRMPFLKIIGNNFGGVGIADSIAAARDAVDELS